MPGSCLFCNSLCEGFKRRFHDIVFESNCWVLTGTSNSFDYCSRSTYSRKHLSGVQMWWEEGRGGGSEKCQFDGSGHLQKNQSGGRNLVKKVCTSVLKDNCERIEIK